jgi:hypothetical protein
VYVLGFVGLHKAVRISVALYETDYSSRAAAGPYDNRLPKLFQQYYVPLHKRVLSQAGLTPNGLVLRGSRIDPYLPFIRATLEKFTTLTASRL